MKRSFHKILILTHGPFPNDVRIEREVLALLSSGTRVCVVANRCVSNHRVETYRGASVIYVTMFFPFGLPVIDLVNLAAAIRRERPDVIQLCDAPLGVVAIALSKLTSTPLIYDAHEMWPLLARYGSANRLVGSTEIPAYFASELLVTKSSRRIITVSSGIAMFFAKYYGCPQSKITVVRNFPSKAEMLKTILPGNLKELDKFLIVFIGGIDGQRKRELSRFVRAIRILKEEKGNTSVVLRIVGGVGVGRPPPSSLVKLVRKLGVSDQVEFVSWVPLSQALQHVASADLCVVASEKNDYTDISLPHKLFQYIYMEKPVLTASLNEIQKLIGAEITYYTSNDPRSLADTMSCLQKRLSELHLRAVKLKTRAIRNMNWEGESAKYLSIFL